MTRSLRMSLFVVDEKCSEVVDWLVLPFRFRSQQFDRIPSLPPQFTQSLENIQFLATENSPPVPSTEVPHPLPSCGASIHYEPAAIIFNQDLTQRFYVA